MLEHIPVGRENAIKRRDLSVKSNTKDRYMREEIIKLQEEGYPIVNLQDGIGYYLADTKADWEKYTRQERARALSRIYSLNKNVYNLKTEYFKKVGAENEVQDNTDSAICFTDSNNANQ